MGCKPRYLYEMSCGVCQCFSPRDLSVLLQVYFRSGDYVEEFGTESIVFLAAESPNVLTGNSNTMCCCV